MLADMLITMRTCFLFLISFPIMLSGVLVFVSLACIEHKKFKNKFYDYLFAFFLAVIGTVVGITIVSFGVSLLKYTLHNYIFV